MSGLRRSGTLRAVLVVLAAVAAFVATAALVRSVVPWPDEGALAARIEYFREHEDEIDLVFVGSSNIARSFDPAVIDAELAKRGFPLRTYNLGADNMQPVEADFVLREVLARRPARLRFAVIELFDFDPRRMMQGNEFSDRAVYWHDGPALYSALTRLFQGPGGRREKARLGWLHVQHAAWRAANAGQGERALAAGIGDPGPVNTAIARAGGFEAIDDREDEAAARVHRQWLASRASYEALLEEIDAQNARFAPASNSALSELRAREQRLRADGVTAIFVIPSMAKETPSLYAVAAAAGAPPILGFNAPGSYPDVFALENRYDSIHVNRAGSVALSRHFAERFAELLARQRSD